MSQDEDELALEEGSSEDEIKGQEKEGLLPLKFRSSQSMGLLPEPNTTNS